MREFTIGWAPLARSTFDIPLAEEMTQLARQQLEKAGFRLIGADKLIINQEDACAFSSLLQTEPLDLLLVFQATFADSTMLKSLADSTPAPIFLWAVPEARSGGRLRLNTLCGINLAAHTLSLQNRIFDYAYSLPDAPSALDKIRVMASAGNVYRRLRGARLGVVGEHPDGMDTCHLDADKLASVFGLQIARFDLRDIFGRVRSIEDEELIDLRAELDVRLGNLKDLEQKPLMNTLRVYKALDRIAVEENLDGFAVRCWPEFFTELGCAACGAMSMLSDQYIPCSCEADINGTVTQLILQWLSNAPAFGTDLVTLDAEEDLAVVWHCGLAPFSMAAPDYPVRGGIHSNRKVPLVMEFPLKAGEVTLARLSQSGGDFRLVVGEGEMISAPPSFSGTSGVLRFPGSVSDVLNTIIYQGLEHHISLTYGSFRAEIEMLAKLVGLPTLALT